jgi:hypothetical protein
MERKQIMKRTGIILIALAVLLAGCAGPPAATTASSGSTTASKSTAAPGYVFKYNDVTIQMHAETAPILEKLGESKSYFEAESCAFQGIEKTYTFPSFSLSTYELAGVDHVASLLLLDDSVETAEGVCLYASLNDVLEVYGDQYTKSLGLYSYTSGKMKLSFLIENDKVTSIEYVALAE